MTYATALPGLSVFGGASTTRSAVGEGLGLRALFRTNTGGIDSLALAATKQRVRALADRPADWDGFGSDAPRAGSISAALATLPGLFRGALLSGSRWRNPNVTVDEHGVVAFEWWCADRKLTLYVSEHGALHFVRVWGNDPVGEMDEGAVDLADFGSLWEWLSE